MFTSILRLSIIYFSLYIVSAYNLYAQGDTMIFINFKNNSYEIQEMDYYKLNKFFKYVSENWIVDSSCIFIFGHTDSIGSYEDNLTLSMKRTQSVSSYMVFKTFPRPKLESTDHNSRTMSIFCHEKYPIADNGSESGRAKNRRVELYFSRNGYYEWFNLLSNDSEKEKLFYNKYIRPWYMNANIIKK